MLLWLTGFNLLLCLIKVIVISLNFKHRGSLHLYLSFFITLSLSSTHPLSTSIFLLCLLSFQISLSFSSTLHLPPDPDAFPLDPSPCGMVTLGKKYNKLHTNCSGMLENRLLSNRNLRKRALAETWSFFHIPCSVRRSWCSFGVPLSCHGA